MVRQTSAAARRAAPSFSASAEGNVAYEQLRDLLSFTQCWQTLEWHVCYEIPLDFALCSFFL